MISGRKAVVAAILMASAYTGTFVAAEVPSQSSSSSSSSGGNGYPSYYSVESGGSSSGGYAPSYGPPAAPSPSPVYGPPPSSGYGVPADTYDASHQYQGFALQDESPFVQHRLFNTAVALTVPLFSFTIPQRSSSVPGGVDLATQAVFGVFALFVVALAVAVPIFFTKPHDATGRSNDREGILNHLMANNKVFNFMGADLSNKIGLDTTKCLQKSICEAHRTPKRYGMIATPFQMFFPPPTNGTEATATIFQIAAKDGKFSKKDCGKKYQCFFDTLDLVTYLSDWWKHAGDPKYVVEY